MIGSVMHMLMALGDCDITSNLRTSNKLRGILLKIFVNCRTVNRILSVPCP